MGTRIESVYDASARDAAATLMAQGYPVAAFNRGVCGIWGNGGDPRFPTQVAQIKGESRSGKKMGATLTIAQLVPLIDLDKVPSQLRNIFVNPVELSRRIGSLCFIRLPVTEDAASILPESLLSRQDDGTPLIQNWDPAGHPAMELLLGRAQQLGVQYPAVTSMNFSGQPEIVAQEEGADFAKAGGIPIFLQDPTDRNIARGSYTILAVRTEGLQLVREGNVPGYLFEYLLEAPLDRVTTMPAKFPQPVVAIPDGLEPWAVRRAIIAQLHNQEAFEVCSDPRIPDWGKGH